MVFETDWTFWLVLAGFVIAFILAFGIGANDVANSFGTSVGSKVLTLKQACILATIFEILGSILIGKLPIPSFERCWKIPDFNRDYSASTGAQVSGTIRKGIVNPAIFTGSELELMLGYVSSLASCCIWLIVATVLNLPVSGTHSIVGAIVGMALVSRGFNSIEWWAIAKIGKMIGLEQPHLRSRLLNLALSLSIFFILVASWFISPLLSGLVSAIVFFLIRRFILRAVSQLTGNPCFTPVTSYLILFAGKPTHRRFKVFAVNLHHHDRRQCRWYLGISSFT